MTEKIRAEIAEIVANTLTDQFVYLEHGEQLAVADAVLAALELRRESRTLADGSGGITTNIRTGEMTVHCRPATRQTRYVTAWRTEVRPATGGRILAPKPERRYCVCTHSNWSHENFTGGCTFADGSEPCDCCTFRDIEPSEQDCDICGNSRCTDCAYRHHHDECRHDCPDCCDREEA